MARIREFRHLFSGARRIVATIRIDLDQARKPPGSVGGVRCKWEGTKEPQPSAELYPEYKQQWIDGIYRWIADELGRRYGHAFETPEGLIEIWLYDPGEQPRCAETLPNFTGKSLSEALSRLPVWDGERGD